MPKEPNDATRRAIEDARKGKVKRFGSVDALFDDLNRTEPTAEPDVKG